MSGTWLVPLTVDRVELLDVAGRPRGSERFTGWPLTIRIAGRRPTTIAGARVFTPTGSIELELVPAVRVPMSRWRSRVPFVLEEPTLTLSGGTS